MRRDALVVEVPRLDVEDGAGLRGAGVDLDLDRPAEQVHVPGDRADRGRLLDVAQAGRGGARLRLAAAQEVEEVVGGARALTEAVLDVGHRRVAVAERPVGVLRSTRHLDRRRQQHRVQLGQVGGAGSQPQLHRGDVGLRAGQQVVVDLHDHPRALGQPGAEAGSGHRLLATGCPGAEPLRVVELLAGPPTEAHVAEAGPAEAGLGLVGLLGRGRGLPAAAGT